MRPIYGCQVNPPTPPRSHRKRERAVSVTPAVATSKKTRYTAADGIQSLNTTMARFGDNVCQAIAGDPAHNRHKNAVKQAQTEGWLPMADRLILANLFEKNINAADAYDALDKDDEEFRQMWLKGKISEVRAQTVPRFV